MLRPGDCDGQYRFWQDDRYCGRSVLQQIGTAADLRGGLAGSAQRGKKKEMSHEEEKSNEK